MGVKIELVLFVTVVFIIGGSLTIRLNDSTKGQEKLLKELEFTNTTFTEVDTKKLQSRAYGTYGVREDSILTINNVRYQTENIKSLVAKQATYRDENIYLEGNVVLHDAHGYTYHTQQAEYNQKTEILNITAPFVALKNESTIKGDTLTYNTRNKEAYGTIIDAVIYTIEK